jgi:hypothetical protein
MSVPTVRRILWVDFTASLVSRVLVALWAFTLLGVVMLVAPWPDVVATGRQSLSTLGVFTVVYTVGAIPVLVLRIRSVRSLFERGERVAAVVAEVALTGGRGVVGWRYDWAESTLDGQQTVRVTDQVRALRVGEASEAVVDPGRPERSLLCSLYL